MRSLGGPLLAAGYRHDLRGVHHLPQRGPAVIVAAGEHGPLTPLALAAWLPRPVRAVGGPGALGGIVGGPIARDRGTREALARGEAVAFTDGTDATLAAAAAAALAGGAAVVPTVLLGTRGRHVADPPRLRSTVTVVVLPPVTVGDPVSGDPLAWPAVREAAECIRQALVDAERTVRRRLGGQQR